jgi:type VI secretion system protein ImpE
VGLIPTRYPDSETSEDDALRLARKTEWQVCADDTYLGYGQRMVTTDADEYPLMDIRTITLDTANATQEESKPADTAEVCD